VSTPLHMHDSAQPSQSTEYRSLMTASALDGRSPSGQGVAPETCHCQHPQGRTEDESSVKSRPLRPIAKSGNASDPHPCTRAVGSSGGNRPAWAHSHTMLLCLAHVLPALAAGYQAPTRTALSPQQGQRHRRSATAKMHAKVPTDAPPNCPRMEFSPTMSCRR